MLSLTGRYALRAVVYLAQHQDEGMVTGAQVAAELAIPRKYLSSVLGILARAGVLRATRGRTGGFRLTRDANDVRLVDVVAPFEGASDRRSCPFGIRDCGDREACRARIRWNRLEDEYLKLLRDTTVGEVARSRRKRRAAPRRARAK